jgi:iron complex outermembrane receptor protein
VLRGPQGSLYGRNAVGGAMNVLSRAPTADFGGSAKLSYSRYDRTDAEATLNLPASDQLRVRLAGWYTDQTKGEYYNPVTGKYLDANNSSGGRLVAVYKPTDALSFKLTVEVTDNTAGGTLLFFPTAGETKSTVARDTSPINKFNTHRYALETGLDTQAGKFTLILGKRDYTLTGVEDTDLTADNPFNLAFGQLGQETTNRTNTVDSKYAELRWLSKRMGAVSLLAGISYLDESATGDIFTDLPTISQAFTGGALPASIAIANNQAVKSWAGFLEGTFELSSSANLIVGARYTKDDKSLNFDFAPTFLLGGFLGPEQTANTTKTFSNFSPGVTLAWTPSADWHLYGKAQSGFRAGGYNFNVAKTANLPYDAETSINFEVGAKRQFLGGRGYAALSVFQLNQKDVLVGFYDPTAPGPLAGYLANAGKSATRGIELESTAKVADGLTLGGSIGYLDAKFISGNAQGTNLDGQQLPAARKLTYAATVAYTRPIGPNAALDLNASYTHRDAGFQDVQNTIRIDGNNLVNASAGVEFGKFEVGLYVKNATDNDYQIASGGFRPPNAFGTLLAPGRTYGGWVQAKF